MLTAVPGAAWLLTMRCICFSMHSPGGSTLTVMTVDSGFCITVAGGSSAPHSAAKRSCFSLACLMRSSSASRRLMRRCSNPSSRGLCCVPPWDTVCEPVKKPRPKRQQQPRQTPRQETQLSQSDRTPTTAAQAATQ
uniref:Putative secreted protein n=1 Tax=Anopheles triannulatus TaxID=58253 RepID=A0A2M4B2G0_9DIPT